MTPLLIYGSGGHARELHELIRCVNERGVQFNVLGWISDDNAVQGTLLKGLPIHDRADAFASLPKSGKVVVAIGAPSARRGVALSLHAAAISSPVLIHPHAWVGQGVAMGSGTQICAGAMLSTDIRVASHVIVNQGATVAHDVVLDDFATLAPGVRLSGAVHVGEGAEIGTGAAVIQGCRIGAWSVVGAGAVVIDDVPPDTTVVGVPARVIKRRAPGWQGTR